MSDLIRIRRGRPTESASLTSMLANCGSSMRRPDRPTFDRLVCKVQASCTFIRTASESSAISASHPRCAGWIWTPDTQTRAAARAVHDRVRVVPRRNPDRIRDDPGRTGEQTGRHGPQADVWSMPWDGETRRIAAIPLEVSDLWWGRDGLTLASDLGARITICGRSRLTIRHGQARHFRTGGRRWRIDVRRRALDGLHGQSRRRDISRASRGRNGR